ncbi:MAG: FtsK/SpoIIIE domain-containing protein [Planctomycetota bacterium]
MSSDPSATRPPDLSAPSSIGRRQIAALADLIDLSNVSESTERDLLSETDGRVQWIERRADQTLDRVETRLHGQLSKLKRDTELRFKELEQQTAAQRTKLEADAQKLRTKLASQSKDSESKTRQEYTHEKWVADSVLEGRLGELGAELQQDREQLETLEQQLESLDEQAVATLRRYRHRDLTLDELPPANEGPESSADVDVVSTHQEILSRQETAFGEPALALRRLRGLLLPTLFIQFVPYLIGGVLILSGVVGTVVAHQRFGWMWSPIFSGIGGLLLGGALVWGGGRLLFRWSDGKVGGALADYRATRVRYADYLQELAASTQAKHRVRGAQAKAERDAAHAKTETKFAPYFEKIRARSSSAGKELVSKVAAKQAQIESVYDTKRDALEAESGSARRALETRLERRRDIIQRRRQRDLDTTGSAHGRRYTDLKTRWETGRDRLLRSLDEVRELEATSNRPWDDPAWADWDPPTEPAPAVRCGVIDIDTDALHRTEVRGGQFDLSLPSSLVVPALLSGPEERSLLIAAPPERRDEGLGMLTSVVMRLLSTLPPGRAKFTLIDPVGLGESFGGLMHLADYEASLVNGRVWSEPAHIDRRLTDLTDHMGQMIQKYLRNDYASIDAYNQQAGELAEPYRFLVAADYPHGFTSEALARLNSIASSGARSGVFVLLLHDVRHAGADPHHLDDLRRQCTTISYREDDGWRWRNPVCERFAFTPDRPPPEALMTQLITKVGRAAIDAGRVQVPFSTITPGEDAASWSRSASDDLEVAVGRAGATRLQNFRLGVGVAQHALVAGKTGSGKSSLLHTLITNLCLWYAPDQLELYLIDFKKGVEFKPYVNRRPPHLRAIAIESDREFGLSILKRLDAMLDERGEKFREVGVANLSGYHSAAPDDPMPRVMLIVDEFQELFSQDDAITQNATLLLDRLVRQGRAFGMHAFLGSQSLSGAAGLPRGTMGQMAVRIALQCSENDSQLILGDENSAARLLTRPGEAIYNDQGGSLEANSLFQVAWLPDHELRESLDRIRDIQESRGVSSRPCYVFEGNAPASVADNGPLNRLLDAETWPAESDRSNTVSEWAQLGEPIAIDDPVAVAFPRLNGSNALILGQNADATLGLMTTALLSLAAAHHPDRARFVVFNGSTEPEHDRLIRNTFEPLPHRFAQVPFRDVDATLAELHAELQHRIEHGDAEGQAPSTFIAIFGLQRFRQFRKSGDGFSFSLDDDDSGVAAKPDQQLQDLLKDGPVVGLHLIVVGDRAASLDQVFDRRALREFDSRVMFQMSATDSAQLIDSSDANDLGPYRALLYREDRGTITRFRPYGPPTEEALARFHTALSRPYRPDANAKARDE